MFPVSRPRGREPSEELLPGLLVPGLEAGIALVHEATLRQAPGLGPVAGGGHEPGIGEMRLPDAWVVLPGFPAQNLNGPSMPSFAIRCIRFATARAASSAATSSGLARYSADTWCRSICGCSSAARRRFSSALSAATMTIASACSLATRCCGPATCCTAIRPLRNTPWQCGCAATETELRKGDRLPARNPAGQV